MTASTKKFDVATRLIASVHYCRHALQGGAHWAAKEAKAAFAQDLLRLARAAEKAAKVLEGEQPKQAAAAQKKPAGESSGSIAATGGSAQIGVGAPAAVQQQSYRPAPVVSTPSSTAAIEKPQDIVVEACPMTSGTPSANGSNGICNTKTVTTGGGQSRQFKYDLRQWARNSVAGAWMIAGKLKEILSSDFREQDFADRRLVIGIGVLIEAGVLDTAIFDAAVKSLVKFREGIGNAIAYLHSRFRNLCRASGQDFDRLLQLVWIPPRPAAT